MLVGQRCTFAQPTDYRRGKQRIITMLWYKRFDHAAVTITGIELVHQITKREFDLSGICSLGTRTHISRRQFWQPDGDSGVCGRVSSLCFCTRATRSTSAARRVSILVRSTSYRRPVLFFSFPAAVSTAPSPSCIP